MLDPADELLRFLRDNGTGPWVRDQRNGTARIEDWVDRFLEETRDVLTDENEISTERLNDLRDMLDEKPDQKSWSTRKIRDIIDDE